MDFDKIRPDQITILGTSRYWNGEIGIHIQEAQRQHYPRPELILVRDSDNWSIATIDKHLASAINQVFGKEKCTILRIDWDFGSKLIEKPS